MFSDPVKQFFDAAYWALNELPNQFHSALDVDALEAFCTQRRRELESRRRVLLCACEDCDTELRITLEDGLGAVVEDVVKLLDLAVAGRTRLDELYIRCQADPSLLSTWGQEKEARWRRLEQLRQTALETVHNLFRAVSGTLGSLARARIPAGLPASEGGEAHATLNNDSASEEGPDGRTEGMPPPPAATSGRTSAEEQEVTILRPRWDRTSRQLWLGDNSVRSFPRHAPAQFTVLDAFQRKGWPASIPNPVKHFSLKDAIDALNHGLVSSRLRFYWRDIDNESVVEWSLTPV
jgi:hypothetical protein